MALEDEIPSAHHMNFYGGLFINPFGGSKPLVRHCMLIVCGKNSTDSRHVILYSI